MTQYIREHGMVPSDEIDRIIAATPTKLLTKEDLSQMGFNSWQDWLDNIINPEPSLEQQALTFLAAA
jgi:hypothetical protein